MKRASEISKHYSFTSQNSNQSCTCDWEKEEQRKKKHNSRQPMYSFSMPKLRDFYLNHYPSFCRYNWSSEKGKNTHTHNQSINAYESEVMRAEQKFGQVKYVNPKAERGMIGL